MNVIVANKNKSLLDSLEIDVIKRLDGEFTVDELIKTFSNFFYNKMFLDITAIKDYQNVNNIQKLAMNMNMDKVILLLDDNPETSSSSYLSKLISVGIYNFTRNHEGLMYLYNHTNTYRDVAHIHQLQNITTQINERIIEKQRYVLGIKNVTTNAGATTLIYMLKKELSNHYNVLAIEVDRNDFMYFKDKDMISVRSNELGNTIMQYQDKDVILVDLNESNEENVCNDVLYLIEPSTIKLNRMILIDRRIFARLNGKKIILNKSLLSEDDVNQFERESSSKIYYSLPPLDDKKDNSNILLPFLSKLGFVKKVETYEEEPPSKKFSLFKF